MFFPQTQSHHLSRSYGAPGTARRGGRDKENAGVLPSKTPVRAPLGKAAASTTGRALGAKTPGMLGKTPAMLGKTPAMLGKTPGVLGTKNVERNIMPSKQPAEDIEPKRLFQNTKPVQASAGPSKSNKTPGRNLRTPAPRRAEAPSPAPLPSAQRTRRRSRSSLQQATPPAWEEEVSLDSILEADIEVAPLPALQEDTELEPETAGPTAIDRPYVPDWHGSIPDPVETMAKLAKMRPLLPPLPYPPPPEPSETFEMPVVSLCSDDDLEHPLLRKNAPSVQRRPLMAIEYGRHSQTTSAPAGKVGSRLVQTQSVRPKSISTVASNAGRMTRPASAISTRTVASSDPKRSAVRPAPRPASAATSIRQPGSTAPRLPTTSMRPVRPTGVRSIQPPTAAAKPEVAPRASTQPAPSCDLIPSPELPALGDDVLDLDLGFEIDLDELNIRSSPAAIEGLSSSKLVGVAEDTESPAMLDTDVLISVSNCDTLTL